MVKTFVAPKICFISKFPEICGSKSPKVVDLFFMTSDQFTNDVKVNKKLAPNFVLTSARFGLEVF